jgi:diaminohydroxyphosphoribosylaminopyrimidine deaminase/5-amino-6-(5-phosphoribosylamino)uracil reductase
VLKLTKRTNVLIAPIKKSAIGNLPRRCASTAGRQSAIDLRWLLKKLGPENVASLLVEGGGETNASFLLGGFANRVAFFYAPKILGGRDSRKAVGGDGIKKLSDAVQLRDVEWKKVGLDLLLVARIK